MFSNWLHRSKLAQAQEPLGPNGFWSGLETFVLVARHHRSPNEILDGMRRSIRRGMFSHSNMQETHVAEGVGNIVYYRSDFNPDILLHMLYFSDDTICVDTISSRVSLSQTKESLDAGRAFSESMRKLGVKLKNPSDRSCPGGGRAQRAFIDMMGLTDMVASEYNPEPPVGDGFIPAPPIRGVVEPNAAQAE